MEITLIANGYDLSGKLSTYEAYMEVEYSKVLVMLDRTERPVSGTKRPVVTFSLLPMTDEESTQVYEALEGLVFTAVFVINGKTMTASMRVVSDLGSKFLLKSPDGKRRYRGGTIKLRGLRSANS